MPTTAQTAKEKRLFSELFNGDVKSKKQRVRFDDDIDVFSENEYDLDMSEEDDEVEFTLSIGEGGDFDYTIITDATASSSSRRSQQDNTSISSVKGGARPTSPFAGSDRRLCEELYWPPSSFGVEEEGGDCCACCEGIFDTITFQSTTDSKSTSRSISTWQNSLGGNLKIFIPNAGDEGASFESGAGNHPQSVDGTTALLTPLITPPESPRRESSSSDGTMSNDVTVICEWPFNLTVDNAITSAKELPL